ncbi:MAG: hypothetical protein NVSMB49_04450 [Ktedonobacteraceae bacterium]
MSSAKHPLVRFALLCFLLLVSVLLYLLLGSLAQPRNDYITPFLQVWMICFLPYLGACAFVLLTSPPSGRWRIAELGIILLGALLFRVLFLPQVPWLSRDSWRYLWDARVILHGYSPYVYAPESPILKPLRDALIYGNSGFLDVPTVYPPVAEGVYVLSYLLAPSNLFVLKVIFLSFDMLTCVGLALLLMQRGHDPRRVVIYAWCPLVIVEFAIEGHVDALTIAFLTLTLLCVKKRDSSFWWRVLLGILIALATLTKLYPILLLVIVTRRRDWAIPLACFATIALAYIPFILLGHGQVFGFFSTYVSEQRQNAGVVPLTIHWLIYNVLHLGDFITVLVQYAVDVLLVGSMTLLLFRLRIRERISLELATLIFIGMIYAISTHIFPWYTPALLLFVPLLFGPLWTSKGMNGKGIAIISVWYFVCTSLTAYFFRSTLDWTLYYIFVYGVTVCMLVVGIISSIMRYGSANHKWQGRTLGRKEAGNRSRRCQRL